jgi:hypothetical protein
MKDGSVLYGLIIGGGIIFYLAIFFSFTHSNNFTAECQSKGGIVAVVNHGSHTICIRPDAEIK